MTKIDEIEEQCFKQETPELEFYCRTYLLDLDEPKLLWILVVGCQYARDGGAINDDEADKILQKLWKQKHCLIKNKFPRDFFSKNIEDFNLEAKVLSYSYSFGMKSHRRHPCKSIIAVLAEYYRRSQYKKYPKMSFDEAQRLIMEIQNQEK